MLDVSTKLDLLISGIRSQQWAKAKGELEAMVQVVGGTTVSRPVGSKAPEKWEVLEDRIKEFVQSVENDGLHE